MGPDWGVNMELCDFINREPDCAADAVKALRKQLRAGPSTKRVRETVSDERTETARVGATDLIPWPWTFTAQTAEAVGRSAPKMESECTVAVAIGRGSRRGSACETATNSATATFHP
eukprot:scaffold331_cov243-Pinguiococcus_pyrenoidosus.AAC.11